MKPTTRKTHIRWVPISDMRVNTLAQRELNPAHVASIAADFDPDQIGFPVVNKRGDHYYIIDGQHRIRALVSMKWEDQSVECLVYEGLTEQQEAEMFLKLNNKLNINTFQKFKIGQTAERSEEMDIAAVVEASGFRVAQGGSPGSIGCVGTLRRVYQRGGPQTLARALVLIRDTYGDAGLSSPVIDGLGILCTRYNGELGEVNAPARLAKANGGVNGLLNHAARIRANTGRPKGQCVAAAAVEIINGGRGGKKLRSFWS